MRDNFICKRSDLKKSKIWSSLQTYLGPLGIQADCISVFSIMKKYKRQIFLYLQQVSVGSTVCQIAKNLDVKFTSTGSDEKVDWLKNELMLM